MNKTLAAFAAIALTTDASLLRDLSKKTTHQTRHRQADIDAHERAHEEKLYALQDIEADVIQMLEEALEYENQAIADAGIVAMTQDTYVNYPDNIEEYVDIADYPAELLADPGYQAYLASQQSQTNRMQSVISSQDQMLIDYASQEVGATWIVPIGVWLGKQFGAALVSLLINYLWTDVLLTVNGLAFWVTYYENEGAKCWANDWEARDTFARQVGTFNHGRMSTERHAVWFIPTGRWYCAMTRYAMIELGQEHALDF